MDITKLFLVVLLTFLLGLFCVKSVYSATLPDSPNDGSSLVNPDETDFSQDIFNNDFSTDVTDTATTTNTTTNTSTLVDNTVGTTTATTEGATTLTDTTSGSNTGVVIILAMVFSSLSLILIKSIDRRKKNVQ